MRVKYQFKDFEEMIERYNPFGFKDKSGKIGMYVDYGKAYYACMQALYEAFPKGFIDVPLFIHEQTGLPIRDAEGEFGKMKSYLGDCDIIAVDWFEERGRLIRELRPFMQALHLITETKFDENFFLSAVDAFIPWLEANKISVLE